jgi:hypothetical protein
MKKIKTKKVKKSVKSLEEIPELLKGEDIELKKEVLETPIEEKEPELTNVNNCEYYLEMQFNNETLKCYTNNLDISIQSFAKEVMTEMFVKIVKGQSEFLKKLTLVQARMLFKDAQSREIFLETFYGLYGRPQNTQLKVK